MNRKLTSTANLFLSVINPIILRPKVHVRCLFPRGITKHSHDLPPSYKRHKLLSVHYCSAVSGIPGKHGSHVVNRGWGSWLADKYACLCICEGQIAVSYNPAITLSLWRHGARYHWPSPDLPAQTVQAQTEGVWGALIIHQVRMTHDGCTAWRRSEQEEVRREGGDEDGGVDPAGQTGSTS